MRSFFKYSILTLTIFNLLACGSTGKDADKVGEAQACLDKLSGTPTASQISACTDKVAGVTSAGASAILCSAMFLQEGFGNPQRYADALSSVNNGTGNSSNNRSFAGLLTFAARSNLANDVTDATNAFNYCQASGGKGATLLSSFSYITMALYNYISTNMLSCPASIISTGSYSYYDFSTCLTNASGNAGNLAALADMVNSTAGASAAAQTLQGSIGSAIIATYNISCQGNSSSTSVCSMINNSITAAGGTSNPRAVAISFMQSSMGL